MQLALITVSRQKKRSCSQFVSLFFCQTTSKIGSYADILLARHAIFPFVGEERLRGEPKECLRWRLLQKVAKVEWRCLSLMEKKGSH